MLLAAPRQVRRAAAAQRHVRALACMPGWHAGHRQVARHLCCTIAWSWWRALQPPVRPRRRRPQVLPLLDAALRLAQEELLGEAGPAAGAGLVPKDAVHARLWGLALHQDGQAAAREASPGPGGVGAPHIDRLLTVAGTVCKAGPVKMLEARRLYQCSRCKHRRGRRGAAGAGDRGRGRALRLSRACEVGGGGGAGWPAAAAPAGLRPPWSPPPHPLLLPLPPPPPPPPPAPATRFVVQADMEMGGVVQLPPACPSQRDKPCRGTSFRWGAATRLAPARADGEGAQAGRRGRRSGSPQRRCPPAHPPPSPACLPCAGTARRWPCTPTGRRCGCRRRRARWRPRARLRRWRCCCRMSWQTGARWEVRRGRGGEGGREGGGREGAWLSFWHTGGGPPAPARAPGGRAAVGACSGLWAGRAAAMCGRHHPPIQPGRQPGSQAAR